MPVRTLGMSNNRNAIVMKPAAQIICPKICFSVTDIIE